MHNNDEPPFVDEYGMDLMANQVTHISLQEVIDIYKKAICLT